MSADDRIKELERDLRKAQAAVATLLVFVGKVASRNFTIKQMTDDAETLMAMGPWDAIGSRMLAEIESASIDLQRNEDMSRLMAQILAGGKWCEHRDFDPKCQHCEKHFSLGPIWAEAFRELFEGIGSTLDLGGGRDYQKLWQKIYDRKELFRNLYSALPPAPKLSEPGGAKDQS